MPSIWTRNTRGAYLGLGMQKFNESPARRQLHYRTGRGAQAAPRQLIQKALALDPTLATAHGMLAMLAMQYDWDWDRAEREVKSAGGSNSGVEQAYAYLLIYRGRFAEADQHLLRLLDMDPFETSTMNQRRCRCAFSRDGI